MEGGKKERKKGSEGERNEGRQDGNNNGRKERTEEVESNGERGIRKWKERLAARKDDEKMNGRTNERTI
jgi:hypothetical protein